MYNASIAGIPMPARMARRPVSDKGFPVPYFVTRRDDEGHWDFRFVDPRTVVHCHRKGLCWLCGEKLGQYLAFVIGPMCAINRVSSEPPSHRECAEYGILACPFLSKPAAKRNDADLTDKQKGAMIEDAPGIAIAHNPGVSLLWITRGYRVESSGRGTLFYLGQPTETKWFKERRTATRAEIDEAIDKGLPYLRSIAAQEGALADLQKQIDRAMPLLPAA